MITINQLTSILADAKDAHTKFEANTGKPDDNWQRWYAEYIIQRLDDDEQLGKYILRPVHTTQWIVWGRPSCDTIGAIVEHLNADDATLHYEAWYLGKKIGDFAKREYAADALLKNSEALNA